MTQKEILEKIRLGKIGILPTDTLYAVAGSAFDKKAVERIFKVKKRSPKKPLIILISSINDLNLFKITLDQSEKRLLGDVWPGKVSVILPLKKPGMHFLHRGEKSLAFRIPEKRWLRSFLKKSGPLVAPSANEENLPPATTINEARKYFGSNVDFYLEKGLLNEKPSTLISIKGGEIKILRPGSGKIS